MANYFSIKTNVLCLLIAIISLTSNTATAQKKKELREGGISSKKEWNYTYINNTEKKYLEAEYQYDKRGNTLLEKLFDENGNMLTHKEFKYNAENNVIQEISYDPKGQIVEKIETTYFKNDLKLEKKIFGPDGKLKSKKIFEYKTY